MEKENIKFDLKEDSQKNIISMVNCDDKLRMNWVSEEKKWGKVIVPNQIKSMVKRRFLANGNLQEIYTFTNKQEVDYFNLDQEIGISVPFPDSYKSAKVCMEERCHAHIWCGEESSYILGIRMSGIGPHLGMVLTKGAIEGYRIERDFESSSNDRGEFILQPNIEKLLPGESMEIVWELCWIESPELFYEHLKEQPNYIYIDTDKYVAFQGEKSKIVVLCGTGILEEDILGVTQNNKNVVFDIKKINGKVQFKIESENIELGEQCWIIKTKNGKAIIRTMVLPALEDLAKKRCEFIATRQQYHNEKSCLDGAYLIYDNETKKLYYSAMDDHNAGRERVGMGALLATYLQKNENEIIRRSLEKYYNYICRELYDSETGIVYNDVRRNNKWHRLYNYPWMAVFFMEYYKLNKKLIDLNNMYQVMHTYYQQGGKNFYAIGIPILESIELLKDAGWMKEAEKLIELYKEHADVIESCGLNYPAHEVNYEQSIVAPGVSILLQVYFLTNENKYLVSAKTQMKVLELFNGMQPDYHLYETAIRHWDGYWFGKRRLLGDTFSHYWSALTGIAYKQYAMIVEDEKYRDKAEYSLRGVLALYDSEGCATCAYVYPSKINGVRGNYADPWANDQDWALYFYLKEGEMGHE